MTKFTRREFATLAGASLVRGAAQTASPPNILWITTEDMSPDMGCYGDRYALTPNLDKFAAQGARFTRAFTVAGVCAPSRSGIITGMYPSSIGTHHMRSKGVPPHYVRCFPEYLREAGYYCTNNVKTDYNFDPPLTAWDESSNKAHWRNRAKGQPFFAVFNHIITHESQVRPTPEQYAKNTAELRPEERHDPAKAVLPPYYPDTPIVRKDWATYHDNITAMDKMAARLLNQLEEDGEANNTVVFFYGDHGRGLPRAKRWIYDSGIHIPLLIRWPGKITPGSINDNLTSSLDFAPTLLNLAGIPIPKHLQGQAFLDDNLPPKRRYIYAARDRMDETYDMMRCVRDERYKYIKNYQPGKPYAQYIDYMDQMPTMREMRRLNKEGTLTGPQRLFFLPEKPDEELYDTAADPHEINNLAKSPVHRPALERLRKEHQAWMIRIKDQGLIPEPELIEKMRPGGQWSVTANPVITRKGDRVSITCRTEGASIAYTAEQGPAAKWKLYSKEFEWPEKSIRAKACRLGYRDSEEVTAPAS